MASCNTLQVPPENDEVSVIDDGGGGPRGKVGRGGFSTNLLLQKFFGLDEQSSKKAAVIREVLDGK